MALKEISNCRFNRINTDINLLADMAGLLQGFLTRSGPRRPLLVNLSPSGRPYGLKIYRGVCYKAFRLYRYVGSPKNGRTAKAV